MLDLGVELLVDLRDARDLRRNALRRVHLAREPARVLDRILDGLGEIHDRQRLGSIAAQQLRAMRVGVGGQPAGDGILEDVGQAGLDLGLELVRSGVAVRVAIDDQHGRGLLAKAVRDQRDLLLLLRAGDEPAALDQLAASPCRPDVQTDDERQPEHRQHAAEAVVESTDGGEDPGRVRLEDPDSAGRSGAGHRP